MYMVASWACEVTEILKQRSTEETSCLRITVDLTSPTSNHIPDIDIPVSVSVLYFINSFSRMAVIIGVSFILTGR